VPAARFSAFEKMHVVERVPVTSVSIHPALRHVAALSALMNP
jgi:hypothetical protein